MLEQTNTVDWRTVLSYDVLQNRTDNPIDLLHIPASILKKPCYNREFPNSGHNDIVPYNINGNDK